MSEPRKFELRPASRQNFKPLIGLFSKSGFGKTYSALLLARGMVGPHGKIGMIDTEQGRGSAYAPTAKETLPMGDYFTVELTPPFSPEAYIQCIEVLEAQGCNIGIIDSISHLWEGPGGVLDMAMTNEEKSGKPGLHNWRKPKFEYSLFLLKMIRSAIPFVCCLRGKQKSHQGKNDQGKTVIVKDDFISPIGHEDFLFEMTTYGEIHPGAKYQNIKPVLPSLLACLPNDAPIEIRHGEMIAAWCAGAQDPAKVLAAPTKTTRKTLTPKDTAKRELWKMCARVHCDDPHKLEQWLWDENLMSDAESLAELTFDRLNSILSAAPEKLKAQNLFVS